MKRIIFLLLVSLLSLTAMAQELTIKSFELTNSLDGKKYARLDANGDACALIKVQLARQGAVFEGNVVGDVAYKTSEYWVYMYTGSTKTLTVKVDGALPLRVYFPDYGIDRLQPNYTYSLVLTLPNVGRQEIDLGTAYFVLQVTPANATVRIDDELKLLEADGSLMIPLAPGSHHYCAEAVGYSKAEQTFQMGREKKIEIVTLQSAMGTLHVTCATADAQIYVNEKLRGTGSWTGILAEGLYTVEARRNGHRPQRRNVTLGVRQTVNCQLDALEAIEGGLDVRYSPINSEIWIDQQKRGVTPDKLRLTAGQHRVEIRKEGYQTFSQQISITDGEVQTLQGELEKVASPSATVATSGSYSSSSSDPFNGHAYVDLGLKDEQGRTIYWATCNIGADRPEDAGLYFAWGETQGYGSDTNDGREFDWANYKWCRGSKKTITKYYFPDHKIVLDPEDDAAHVHWGGDWRMPTKEELNQLREKCTWTWDGTKNGYVVKGPNGNSLFLATAGRRWGSILYRAGSYGDYWSLSSSPSEPSYYACCLYFHSSGVDCSSREYRPEGRTIRAVCVSAE